MGLLSRLGGLGPIAPQMSQPAPPTMAPGGGIGGGMGGEMGAMQGAFGGNPQFMAQLQALMQGQGPGMAPPRFMGSGGLPPLQGPPAGKGVAPGAAGGFGSVDLQKLLRGY